MNPNPLKHLRSLPSRTSIALAWAGLGLCLAGALAADPPCQATSPADPAWAGLVTNAAELPVETASWGTLQWLCNATLMPGVAQTLGLATILPGQRNPVHYHPNCEEILHVLSGQGLHSYDGRSVALKPGMTLLIPAKVKHNLTNTGTEPLRTLISFSSGDRKTVFLEKPAAN